MRAPKTALTRLLAGALTLLFAPHCTVEAGAPSALSAPAGAEGEGEEAGEGALLWAATWSLTWDRSRTVPSEEGGFSVETDLGYAVRVHAGFLVAHSVSFGPCAAPAGEEAAARGLFELGIRSARAHEGADPSAIEAMFAEDLTSPDDAGPWPTTFPAARYCYAHWLAAKPIGEVDVKEGVDLENRSMLIAGTWERDGVSKGFEVDTWWPQARLDALTDILGAEALAAARADGKAWAARVTVERDLGGLFDGIDFETASDAELAGQVLSNLAEQAETRVELFRPEGG
jgi:hypothetical protein